MSLKMQYFFQVSPVKMLEICSRAAILNIIQNYNFPQDELLDEAECIQHEDLAIEIDP